MPKTVKIILTLIGLFGLVALLGGIKALQIRLMMGAGAQFEQPPETVTVARVEAESWETLLHAVGSLDAVQGVTVAADLPGKVVGIDFKAGSRVKKGDLLVQQDVSTEKAQLPGAEAAVSLTRLNLLRMGELLEQKIISQAEYDSAEAEFQQARAQADNLRAVIEKKTIRAPFSGRLGIRLVNLGQSLREGEGVVSLQVLDPIFVNFSLPQQQIAGIGAGVPVRISSDTLPGEVIEGKITAVNPEVDAETRNIRVQATVSNSGEKLRPGMFVVVAVILSGRQQVLAIPATAVLYAPYSDSVFLVEEKPGKGEGAPEMVLRQQFVRLGEKRGDFVNVASGLEEGQAVVTTGVFKLRNGQAVVVDNTLAPDFKLDPAPGNE